MGAARPGVAAAAEHGLSRPRRTEMFREPRPPGFAGLRRIRLAQLPCLERIVAAEIRRDEHGPGGVAVVDACGGQRAVPRPAGAARWPPPDRKSARLKSRHQRISYVVLSL